jgi:hypothetical protein
MMKPLFILLFSAMLTGCATSPADVRRQSIEKKLDAIVLPEIQFRDAEQGCILNFLHYRSIELDKEGKGVNIIFIFPDSDGTPSNQEDSPFGDRGMAHTGHVDMDLKDISLREALNIMCELGGYRWKIEDSVVKVSVKPNRLQPIVGGDRVNAPPQR